MTAGIPGTGLSWTSYTPHARPASQWEAAPENQNKFQPFSPNSYSPGPYLSAIESGPIEKISALSTSELAPLLDTANNKLRCAPVIQVVSICLFVAAFVQGNQLWLGLSALYATVLVPCAIYLDRYRRSVRVAYEPRDAAGQIAEALSESFRDLMESVCVWRINTEGRTFDWKRNAGATTLNTRQLISVQFDKPLCIRGTSSFPALKLGPDELYLLPDAALLVAGGEVTAINYQDFHIANSTVRYIEEDAVPSDSPVVDRTWRFVSKRGGPDRRFNNNKELPICIYGELSFLSESGLNYKIHSSNPVAGNRLCKVVEILHSSPRDLPRSIASVETPKRWPLAALSICASVLGTAQVLLFTNFLDQDRTNVSRPRQAASVDARPAPQPVIAWSYSPRTDERVSGAMASPFPNIPEAARSALIAPIPMPRPRPKF